MASQLKNNLRTIVAVIETALFSGVVFGWANMVLILKNEEYFKDLCEESARNATTSNDDESGKCGKQDERLALVFTISVFGFNAGGFIGGAVLDRLGTRIVRLIACFLYLLTGIFAFVLEKDTANVVFPLLVCLAAAGMFVAITNFQVAMLHPKHQLIVSSSLSGAIDSSSVIFLVFKTIYDAGVELRWIIVGYAVIAIVFVLSSTFLLLPKISIAAEQEQLQKETSKVVRSYSNQAVTPDVEPDQEMTSQSVGNGKEFNDITKQSSLENDKAIENGFSSEKPASQEEDKYSSGWRYILTAKFLWLLYFFCLVQLRLWFFVASLNSYLIYYTDDDKDKIETYSEIFGLVQFFGFFFAPFTGLIMNIQPRNTTNVFFGSMLSFIITLLLCVILSALVLVPVLEIQYFAFVVQVAMRAFLFASLISFILRAFPIEHYGKLYGAATMIGAVVLLLQYPIVVIMDGPANSNPYWINFGFFMASFTAVGFPLYLWLSNRNSEEVSEEVTTF